MLMRLILPQTLASDDAMEAFFSQQFHLVYSLRQPLLYSWLVYAAKNLLGDISLALVAVRYLLLFIMYTGLFLSASIMFTNRRVIVAVMVSYLLIRQYASLSHLVIFLAYYYAAQQVVDAEVLILEKNKLEHGGITEYLYSLLTFGSASLVFSSPLLIVVAILFPGLLFSHHFILPVDAERHLLAAQILIAMLVLVVTGFLLGIGNYKPRWVFPALILLPFYLFSVLEVHPEYLKRAKKYIIGVAIFSVITLVSRYVNVHVDSYEGKGFHRILPIRGLKSTCHPNGVRR
ncbi:hypothetical protein [Solemya elarraichensis gill symbiont]|nr:hypothetical protein [Solemya elarraichensis gill symbiont]